MLSRMKHLNSLLSGLLGQFQVSGHCCLCDTRVTGDRDLCDVCRSLLPFNRAVCRQCGSPLAASADTVSPICGSCLTHPPPVEQTLAPFLYQYPVDHMVTSLKLGGQLLFARLLGQLMMDEVRQRYRHDSLPKLLIPVPLHPNRLLHRGFNQSGLIAGELAGQLRLPLGNGIIRRSADTPTQTGLTRSGRRKNVRRAFRVDFPLACSHIAIIDDVMTTGSTLHEVARVLKRAGVERVDAWVFARTPL